MPVSQYRTEIRYRSVNGVSVGIVTHKTKALAERAMRHAKDNPQTVLSAKLYRIDPKGKEKLQYEAQGYEFDDPIPF